MVKQLDGIERGGSIDPKEISQLAKPRKGKIRIELEERLQELLKERAQDAKRMFAELRRFTGSAAEGRRTVEEFMEFER